MPGSAATPPEPAPPPSVGELLLATVPMARTMGIEFGEVTPERAVARLPDQIALHNHVGGPHAGALFTLGESASGAVVLAAFGGHDRVRRRHRDHRDDRDLDPAAESLTT